MMLLVLFALGCLVQRGASQTEIAFSSTCEEHIVDVQHVYADPDPDTIVDAPSTVVVILEGIVLPENEVPDGSVFNMTAKVLGLDIFTENGALCELSSEECPLTGGEAFEVKYVIEIPECPPFGQSIAVDFKSSSPRDEPITCLEIPIRLGCA